MEGLHFVKLVSGGRTRIGEGVQQKRGSWVGSGIE